MPSVNGSAILHKIHLEPFLTQRALVGIPMKPPETIQCPLGVPTLILVSVRQAGPSPVRVWCTSTQSVWVTYSYSPWREK